MVCQQFVSGVSVVFKVMFKWRVSSVCVGQPWVPGSLVSEQKIERKTNVRCRLRCQALRLPVCELGESACLCVSKVRTCLCVF